MLETMRARRFTDFFHGAGLLACVVFIFALLQIPRAEADFIIDIPPPSFVPNIDLDLALSINNKTIIAGSTINLPTGTALAVSISAAPKDGGTADWSPVNSLDGSENSQTYWSAFYLDFYKGEIFSDATFISGEQMNAHDTVLKTTSTVTFPEPGTYSAVLYDSDQFRDYDAQCSPPNECRPSDVTIEDVREGIEKGQNFGQPPTEFIGVVTFTIPEDPCATPGACASNVLFLPGIEGSRLYEGMGCGKTAEEKLWDPIADSIIKILRGAGDDKVKRLFLDEDGKSVCSDIYAKADGVIDSVRGNNIYKSFIDEMNGLENEGTINDWKPVAYDWRLSLSDLLNKGAERDGKIYYTEATSTPYIEQTLRALAGSSKTGKVTIVAHSNGGLVAKALLNQLGGETSKLLVDKVIMVGAPQTGAPIDIGALLYGMDQGISSWGITILHDYVARELAQNSPMAYHLLPSEDYLKSIASDVNHPVARFAGDAYAKEIGTYGATINNTTELDNFILASTTLNSSLIDYANGQHATLDFWTPPEGIEVSQIAGWGADTVAGIDFYTPAGTAVITALEPQRKYKPIFTEDGDGTVPVPSALMMATSTSVKRYWVDLHSYNKLVPVKRIHKDLFEIPQLEDFIKNIIKNSTSTLPAYISTSQPSPTTDSKKLIFFLHSPLTLELADSLGNVTGLATDGSMTQDILGSSYGEFGEVKYIIVPEGNYTLNMNGQASGTFTLEMQESSGGIVTASSTIANVPTTADTLASLTISGGINTASALAVDEDGDGATDITITPEIGATVNYEPPAPEPEPEADTSEGSPSTSSGSSGGGGVSFVIVATTTVATTTDMLATASTSSPQAISAQATTQPVATSTPEIVASTMIVQTKKKQVVAINNVQVAETPKKVTNIPQTPLEIRFLTGQTASVYDAVSQQSVFARLGNAVYNGIYSFWLALKKFF